MTDEQRDLQVAEFRDFIDAVRAGKTFSPGEVPDHLLPLARSIDWIREHLETEAADVVGKVHCPVFIGQGGKDFQVKVRDAELLDESARAAGVTAELAVFPDLDHLFKHVNGESKLEQYYDRTRRVNPAFLARLLGWFQQVP